jgi:enoyl-CoA hydratase
MGGLVDYRVEGSIATITMDDGKVNALSPAMLAALNEAFDRAAADQTVVVLTGRPGTFSAGFDLNVLRGGGADARDMVTAGFALAERILSFPTPVVIACTGHALAMGVFLLLSGDHRVGATGSYKIGANEVAIGMPLPSSAVAICRGRLAPAHFQRATVNAEIYPPDQAVVAGFLDEVVPAADLPATAHAVAERLAALDFKAHAETKLRTRADTLIALRQSIAADTDAREALT